MVFNEVVSLVLLSAVSSMADAEETKFESIKTEKCYGVVSAGKNDCYANAHVCAGEAKTDADPYEWIILPEGLCKRLNNGYLQPGGNLLEAQAEKILQRKLQQAKRNQEKK